MSDAADVSGVSNGRELPAGAFVPRHGGGMLKPWKPGQTGNAGGRGGEYLETQRLARTASPDAMRKLFLKMDSDDERVAVLAQQGVLTWAFGKPKDYDPNEAKNSGLRFDIDALTPEERSTLLAIIRRGAVRQADPDSTPETVDAVAEPQPEAQAPLVDSTPPTAPKRKRRR